MVWQLTRTMRRITAKQWRDAALFIGGMALLFNEAVVHQGSERPTLILAALSMMGLTFMLRADEKKRNGD